VVAAIAWQQGVRVGSDTLHNGRAAYLNNSTNNNLPLDPAVVLRAGKGTGGNSALPFINFVRMSSQRTATQGADFTGGPEVVKIATDDLAIASTARRRTRRAARE
jgi:hypothetical protein